MKRSKIPSLDDLRAFEAVARLGSVRAAAEDLALTHSAVSRRITKLSSDLNIALLRPDGRGVKLTPEGEKISNVMQDFFATLTNTIDSLQSTSNKPVILLSCERSVAMYWLIPQLSEFQDKEPNLSLNLSVGGGAIDFKREPITLALRRLDFKVDPSWRVEKLFDEEMGPVLTKEQLDNFSKGNYIGLSSKTRPNAWKDWLKLNPDVVPPKEYMLLDHHFLMVESALSGLGVAISPKVLALNEINKGRLIAPFGFQKDGSYYSLIFQNDKALDADTKKLVDWINNLSKKYKKNKIASS